MHVSKDIPPKLKIPSDSVYKVQLLNSSGNPVKTVVFARGDNQYVSSAPDTQDILSLQQLHPDDSVRIIKKKILAELWKHGFSHLSYEEMYLTAYAETADTVRQLFQSIVGDGDDRVITKAQWVHVLTSFGLSPDVDDAKETYTESDVADVLAKGAEGDPHASRRLSRLTCFGQRFVGKSDALFQTSPYQLKKGELVTMLARWKRHGIQRMSFENDLLLNYGRVVDQTLFLYLAEDVLRTVSGQPVDALIHLYYPLLYEADVRTVDDWETSHAERIRATRALLDERSFHLYDSVQMFYDVYYGRTSELKYEDADTERGIKSVHLRIDTGFRNQLPLESIFKQIHCSKEVPMIKYNPGARRENVYRLYYEKLAKDGTKIPYLPERLVTRMVRERGKSNRISMYVLQRSDVPMYVHLDKDGWMDVLCQLKQAVSVTDMDVLLRDILNPVIRTLNGFLQMTGFLIRPFYSLDDAAVEVVDLTYVTRVPIHHNVHLKTIGCISALLKKTEAPLRYTEKTDYGNTTHWRYKRVDNYVEMDAESALIRQLHRPPNAITDVMNGLMEEFGMTADEAKARYIDFLRTHTEVEGEVVDHPGFPVVFREKQLDNMLEMEFREVSSVAYIERIQLYVDSILRITQNIRSTSVTRDHIANVCRRGKDTEHADMPHMENVVARDTVAKMERAFNLAEELGFTPEKEDEEDANAIDEVWAALDLEDDEEEDLGYDDPKRAREIRDFYKEHPKSEMRSVSPALSDDGILLSPAETTPSADPSEDLGKPVAAAEPLPNLSAAAAEPSEDLGKPVAAAEPLPNLSDAAAEPSEDLGKPVAAAEPSPNLSAAAAEPSEDLGKSAEPSASPSSDDGILLSPVEENPSAEKPSVEKPSVEKPSVEKPSVEKPSAENPSAEKPSAEKPSAEKPSVEKPSAEKPSVEKPSVEKPLVENPSASPSSDDGILLSPVEEKPSAEKPSATPDSSSSEDYLLLSPVESPVEDDQTGGAGKAKAKAKDDVPPEDSDEDVLESNDVDELSDRYVNNPDGAPLKSNSNPFLKRMMRADSALFLTTKQGKYKAYARSCQHGRHPVLITDAEKRKIDRQHPGSYEHAVRYGSDSKHANWYICPRFWCFLTNSSISEEDVKAGKCGKIIPKDAKKIPHGSYVYEFTSEDHYDTKGNYVQHHPGFMPEGRHPEGYCLPCCYKNWDTASQVNRRKQCAMASAEEADASPDAAAATVAATAAATAAGAPPLSVIRYILSLDTYPVQPFRWGFLPIPVQLFLQVDYANILEKTNSAMILPNVSTLLRYGVEQSPNQSFLGVFADIYAFYNRITPVPPVAEFKQILLRKVTLEAFTKMHNGGLVATFRPKDVAKLTKRDLARYAIKPPSDATTDGDLLEYWSDAVAAYENFRQFLDSTNNTLDHVYLWDLITSELLYPIGLNLVLMEIVENDMTDTIQLICPTNSFSSRSFDPRKPSLLVLKHDEFYEPIYQYKYNGKTIETEKLFTTSSLNKTIRDMLKSIYQTASKHCAPRPSMPTVYHFKETVPLVTLVDTLAEEDYRIQTQIMHYNGRIVGVVAKRTIHPETVKTAAKLPPMHAVYLPCHPSAPLPRIPVVMMDELDAYAVDYEETKTRLTNIHDVLKQRMACLPKLKVLEKGLVVGILTETNQFVPIQPPSENIADDGLPAVEYGELNGRADKSFATNRREDRTRQWMSTKIRMESQFYHLFRSTIREMLRDERSKLHRADMVAAMDHMGYTYRQKIDKVTTHLRELVQKAIVFHDIDEDVLMELGDVMDCSAYTTDESAYCILKDNGHPQVVIPKRHLLSGLNNEKIYYARMADELIRNGRVRLFMMHPEKHLNVHDTHYRIHANEFLIIQSQWLDKDTSQPTTPFQVNDAVKHTTFASAMPAIHPRHMNDPIQWDDPRASTSRDMTCVKEIVPIVGNNQSMWKRLFPEQAREIVFHNTAQCTFYPLVYVLMDKFPNKINRPTAVSYVKQVIWASYWRFLDTPAKSNRYLPVIVKTLKSQGKQKLMLPVEKGTVTLEEVVLSDGYYMSDMDLWVAADALKLPIVVFNANGIKGFGNVEWLKLGGELNEKYFFVRSTITTDVNRVSSYHLIQPAFKLDKLQALNRMILHSVRKETAQYDANMQTLSGFLAGE